jgi:predicted RecB family endonuclease
MVSELLVAADLTKRGFHVFRALSSAAPFDLVAHKDQETLRVEVTTGQYQYKAIRYSPQKDHRCNAGIFDLLAVVCDGKVHYYEAW